MIFEENKKENNRKESSGKTFSEMLQEAFDELSPINEMNIVSSGRYSVSVDRDTGDRSPTRLYFKFYRGKNYEKSGEVARIPFLPDPDGYYSYIVHDNKTRSGKSFELRSGEFDILLDILNGPPSFLRYKNLGFNVWESCVYEANRIVKDSNWEDKEKFYLPTNLQIPDYKNLLIRR